MYQSLHFSFIHPSILAFIHIVDNKAVPIRTPSSSDHRHKTAEAKDSAPLPPANRSATIALLKSRPFHAHSTQAKQELVRVICDAARSADLAAYVPPGTSDDQPRTSAVVDANTVAFALGFYSKATGPFPHTALQHTFSPCNIHFPHVTYLFPIQHTYCTQTLMLVNSMPVRYRLKT